MKVVPIKVRWSHYRGLHLNPLHVRIVRYHKGGMSMLSTFIRIHACITIYILLLVLRYVRLLNNGNKNYIKQIKIQIY